MTAVVETDQKRNANNAEMIKEPVHTTRSGGWPRQINQLTVGFLKARAHPATTRRDAIFPS